MASFKFDDSTNFVTASQNGPTQVDFTHLNAQTADAYPRRHTRELYQSKASWSTRLNQRTSYSAGITYPDDPSNAAWTKTNATGTSAQIANPNDGAVTGAKLVETAATGAHNISRSFTFTATSHVLTAFARYLDRTWVRFLVNDGTEDFEGTFNLTDGTTRFFQDVINPTTLNGGFETAGGGGADVFANWSEAVAGTTSIVRDTSIVFAGSASCKFVIDSSANYGAVEQAVLTPGRRYRLTAYCRSSAGTGKLLFLSNSGSDLFLDTGLLPSGVWTTVTADFYAVGTTLGIYTSGSAASTSVWVDSITLVPLSPIPLINTTTRNGGFETAGGGGADVFANWTESVAGTTSIVRDTVVFSGGVAACKFVIDGSGNYGAVEQSVLQVGRRYRLAALCRSSAGTGKLLFLSNGGADLFLDTGLIPSGTWTSYSAEFTAVGTSLGIYTSGSAASTNVWVDNVCVTPIDNPTLVATRQAAPGDAWYRLTLVCPWVRAAAGTITLGFSTDGNTLSYAGDTAKGAYLWRINCRSGTASDIGPAVPSLGTILSVSAPDVDVDDPHAYLVGESSPSLVAIGDLCSLTRTYARIPGQQTTRDFRSFSRPNPSGMKSGSTYAASLDKGESFHLWTSRKIVLGSTNTAGTTTSNALPAGSVTITLSDASTASFAANASKATIDAALAAVVGVYPNKLASCYSFVGSDGSATTIFWSYWAGGPTVSSVVGPSGTNVTVIGAQAQIKGIGVSITPDSKLIQCTSHGSSVGELCAIWNGNTLLSTASVAGVTDANTLALVLSDLNSPDFNITHLTFASQATYRYAAGAKGVRVKVVRDYFLPGVTMLSGGTIMSDLDSIPDVTTYDSPQGWLDRIVASATTVAISSSDIGQEAGPLAFRDVTYVIMDGSALQSLSLT